ncbi:TerC/Alx family metal homeostasis membrane protein [Bacteroidota bacterium]
MHEIIFFTVFIIFIVSILIFDLLFVGKKSHVVSFKEASIWVTVWISIALLFYIFLRFYGDIVHGISNMSELQLVVQKYSSYIKIDMLDFEKSLDIYRKDLSINYLSGYLIEESLSVDNLFVIMMILTAFSVREKYYKQVLFWGILGAIVFRCIFIFVGAALIQRFEWILLIFGGYLIYLGIKMFIERNKEEKIEPQKHIIVKFLSKYLPVFPRYVKGYFFLRKKPKIYITPLFVVLILIEFTDIIFAFDSIPAIFSVTRDPYIVFFSNIFAIIGLRSLFFFLVKIVHMFRFLKAGISLLLLFIGIKLLAHEWLEHIGFTSMHSLFVILTILAGSILFSVLFKKETTAENKF